MVIVQIVSRFLLPVVNVGLGLLHWTVDVIHAIEDNVEGVVLLVWEAETLGGFGVLRFFCGSLITRWTESLIPIELPQIQMQEIVLVTIPLLILILLLFFVFVNKFLLSNLLYLNHYILALVLVHLILPFPSLPRNRRLTLSQLRLPVPGVSRAVALLVTFTPGRRLALGGPSPDLLASTAPEASIVKKKLALFTRASPAPPAFHF